MLAIISDIHANVEALTTVYRWLDQNRVDEVLCLGDVVGYGADPNGVCDLVRQRCKVCLLGNHDAAVIGAMATDSASSTRSSRRSRRSFTSAATGFVTDQVVTSIRTDHRRQRAPTSVNRSVSPSSPAQCSR